MSALLTEKTGEQRGRVHPLETAPLVIGRSADAGIVVPNALVSRQHARISWDGEAYVVEDLGTRNGTLVNRQALVAPRRLVNGDEIALPGLVLVFRSTDETMTMAAPPRPAATTTFLFADLRGYTPYIEKHGDQAAEALIAAYRALMRAEIARAGGNEIGTEGDNFFVQFESAQQALRCGIGMLRAADRASTERPHPPIQFGVGIHAGEPVMRAPGDFVGSAVTVAARLAANAKAGELLVSDVVRGLVRTSGIAPMEERMGVALKGVDDPPRIYVVDWAARDDATA